MSSNRAERNKRLAELLKRKGKGKKDTTEDLYEEVSEDEYDAYHDDENFVEDDDKAGYIKGQESEEEQEHSDGYEEERSPSSSKRKRKAAAPKKEVKELPMSRSLVNMFAKVNNKQTPAREQKQDSSTRATDDDLMNDIFSEMEQDIAPRKSAFNSAKRVRPMATSRYASLSSSSKPPRFFAPSRAQNDPVVEKPVAVQKSAPTAAPASAPAPAPEKTATVVRESEDEFYDAPDVDMDTANTSMDVDMEPKQKDVETLDVQQVQAEERKMKFKEDRPDLQTWQNAEDSMFSADTATEVARDDDQKMEILEEDSSLHIWWYDAYERREKGYVYLFGKVFNKSLKKYVSCCVTVRNIERNIFVLPREYALGEDGNPTEEEVSMAEVHGEISDICSRHRIHQWASKPVTRKYAFELPNVPMETDYLKMIYSYEQPSLPADIQGKTFSRIFGANTGPLELFLVKRDIMGPCWLKVQNAKVVNANDTWCKVQVIVDDPKTVNPIRDEHGNEPTHVPPLVVLSISLRTAMNQQKGVNEIVAASGVVCPEVKIDEPTPIEEQKKMRFAIIRQLTNVPYPAGFNDMALREKQQSGFSIQIERTEGALLNFLLAKIHVCDPDVIVGHNFAGFDLDVLLHRMKALGTQNWHKLGRLRRKNWPKLQIGAGGGGESTYQERMIMSGRLVCDTYLASKDLIRSKSYRLTDLAQSQLKIAREDIEFDKITKYYEDAKSLLHMVKHCSFDAFLSTALMFKLQILPLTKQLTNLAGNLWSRTMTGARAERNEFLLLHEFHRQKYICPDKAQFGKSQAAMIEAIELDQDEEAEQMQTRKSKSSRRKPAYTGGLVLEPKRGFYDKYVLLLDFNSLYPSIIQEYNVCFTTVERQKQATADEEERVPDIPDKDTPPGVLPRLIKTLVDRRRQVKKLMKDPKISEATMMQYDIRQKALKLTANSMYGCLGFSHSRFYAKPLAMLITHKGREILQNTVDLAGSLDLNVIYGDTDSIMVYTNENDINKVKEMGNLLKKRVNEHYSLLEIDIDGMFKHMLLLKKKKYAALLVEEKPDGTMVESVETKGLDLVRRDWCDLSHDVSSRVLSAILSDKDREEVVDDIHAYLRTVGEQIRQGEIPLEKYVINKQLTKNPQEYADAKSQPHVQVALRMRQAGISVRSGDTVPYVICVVDDMPSGNKSGFAERAYHPDDVMRNNMKLDIDYYLNQQIHPPVARLCAPIEGTDAARLAECLGLDPSKYNVGIRTSEADQSEEFATLDSQISDAERFKNCERLTIKCEHCQTSQEFAGVVREQEEKMVSGLQCTSCGNIMSRGCIGSQMILAIRKHIRKYYEGWLVCDDTTCRNRTRQMSVFGRRCLRDNCHGAMRREYTDKQLYTQLLYYSSLVDTDKAKTNAQSTAQAVQVESIVNRYHDIYAAVKKKADAYLDRSGYRHVDLAKLLSLVTI